MKQLVVVIDDLRAFPALEETCEVLYARTSRSGVELIEELSAAGRTVSLLALDHDLGEVDGDLDDILPVVDVLAERAFFGNPFPVEQIVVHSSNPVGADAVVRSLERYYPTRRLPADSVVLAL